MFREIAFDHFTSFYTKKFFFISVPLKQVGTISSSYFTRPVIDDMKLPDMS